MRLEKGYRVWAADITPDETPLEAGLRFCVKREGGFLGAEALGLDSVAGEERELPAPERRLRCVVLDDPRSVALGNEPVRLDGDVLARATSGRSSYPVERSIVHAYL